MSHGPVRPAEPAVNGWNAEYLESIHARWKQDPAAIDPQWQQFFAGFDLGVARSGPAPAPADRPADHPAAAPAPAAAAVPAVATSAQPTATDIAHSKQGKVDSLIFHYRTIGHLAATIDPLGSERPFPDQLTLESFELTDADLAERFDPGILPVESPAPLGAIIELLEDTYCRNIGVEYMHIQDRERRRWLQRRMEATRNRPEFPAELRLHLLKQLAEADTFETFLQTRYQGKKRFGLEGGESLIPILDQFIELAPQNGVEELALGMAHRGRLNVLVNVLHKTYAQVFTEFDEAWTEDFVNGGGDVKYHQGYSSDRTTTSGHRVHLTLAANPSHLEFITSVVLGRARAKQQFRDDVNREKVVPVVMHGDAALPGQGVVSECFNMMRLAGYSVGGTLHVVINNQVGFTTDPEDLFSGRYCTDLAKMVDAPIFHVNGDDPEACAWAARLALEFRQAFKNDVVIDLWCYRKHGHNETDEPFFTQPLLYSRIRAHRPVLQRYAEELVAEGVATREQVKAICAQTAAAMEEAQNKAKEQPVDPTVEPFRESWEGLVASHTFDTPPTGVPRSTLAEVARALGAVPRGFAPHARVEKVLEYRATAVEKDAPIDWALAEMLAYGTLLREGHPIRITGQDVERGTFSHRHAVVHDQRSGANWTALAEIAAGATAQASGGRDGTGESSTFTIYNSPLTESACVGFEYGYSLTDPRRLIIWEAQFGDFANGAQVFIDQFLASGEIKWQRSSGLVLLLPHGYEGQGPEHSSARLERFLQLCSNDNLQVCYPTTAAQLFHLLRRQVKASFRKPLVIMSPKSMLRLAEAGSPLRELTEGRFECVLDDASIADPTRVNRVLLCSGKIHHELVEERRRALREDVAIVRLEQLYPFPEAQLRRVLARYTHAPEPIWVQEEPRNMGAWRFVDATLREQMDLGIEGITRPSNASPAAGSSKIHVKEQAQILGAAVGMKGAIAVGAVGAR